MAEPNGASAVIIERPPLVARRSGARSGALIASASLVATGLNYIFLLAAGRLLGSNDYGTLAALLGLMTLILLPTGALQLGVSREVSRRLALGDSEGADAFGRAALRLGLLVTAPIVAIGLALAVPLGKLLNIGSTEQVALAACGLVAALAFPIAIGVLQGYQRFPAVAALYVLPFALRLLLLALIAGAGYRLGGAVVATVVGAVASAAIAVALLREPLKRGAHAAQPAIGPFLRYLFPVVVGLIGIAVITNVDLLVVKARFSPDEAGQYAAASAFARVAFFLPATILAVLFPLTAARQARGEETADILGRALMVTAAFGGLLTLFYASAGRGLVHTSFGAEFANGGDLLVPLTLSMALFALANVLVGFHLSRGEIRYAWMVASAVPVQIAILTLVPESVRGVIWADVIVGVGLIATHELLVGSSARALIAGLHHFRSGIHVTRRAVVEVSLVFVGATAVVGALFWPVVAHISSTVIGWPDSDSAGSVAWFWRTEHEGGFHLLGTTQHTLTGAPIGWEEGNGLNLQWLLPYYPAYLVAKVAGEVAAYNLAAFAGYVLSGAAMYLVTRYLGCVRLVSAWAALVYIIFPRHVAHAQHASLVHIEVLALLLLALIAAAQRPQWWRFFLVGVATLACWLTSGYFGVMAVVAAIGFSLGAAATITRSRGLIVLGSAASSLAATALVVGASMLSGVGRDAGLDRKMDDLARYGLRPLELVVPPDKSVPLSIRLEDLPSRFHGSNPVETANYLGLLTITLAIAWIIVAVRRRASLSSSLRAATAGLAAVVVVGLLFAGASPVVALGHDVRAPSGYLFELVPAMRVPSRWVLVVMTALLPLAALALQMASASVGRMGRRIAGQSFAAVALVGCAMVVSLLELDISPTLSWYRTEAAPRRYDAVARTPRGILAEYPLIEATKYPRQAKRYAFWQRSHGRPLLNGAPRGTRADDMRRVLLDPGARGTAEQLALLGVTAITMPAGQANIAASMPGDPAPEVRGSGYKLVARFADRSSVWRVVAAPAPALVTLPDGFGEPRRAIRIDGLVGYPLVQPGVGTIEFTARMPGVVRLSFDAIPPRGGERTVLRVADSEGESAFTLPGRTSISILVQIPRGRSVVRVKSDPAPRSEDESVLLTAPHAAIASGRPALRAELRSRDPDF